MINKYDDGDEQGEARAHEHWREGVLYGIEHPKPSETKGGVELDGPPSFEKVLPIQVPDQYCLIRNEFTGEVWIKTLDEDEPLDLRRQIGEWLSENGLGLAGDLISKLPCTYYAVIRTDARAYDSPVVWESGGFYTN